MQLPQLSHICHLLTTQLAQTLACSLILSRLDYCNAVLQPPRHSIWQHPEATACSERRQGDHIPSYYCTSCTGCWFNIESHTSWQYKVWTTWRPAYLSRATWHRTDSTLEHDHSTVRTIRQYSIRQACIPMFCSGHLELTAKNSCWQRITRNI